MIKRKATLSLVDIELIGNEQVGGRQVTAYVAL